MAVDLRHLSKKTAKTIHPGKIGVGVLWKRNVVDSYESDEKIGVQLMQLVLQPGVDVRCFETTLAESQNLNRLSGKLRLLLKSLLQQSPPCIFRRLLRTLSRGRPHA